MSEEREVTAEDVISFAKCNRPAAKRIAAYANLRASGVETDRAILSLNLSLETGYRYERWVTGLREHLGLPPLPARQGIGSISLDRYTSLPPGAAPTFVTTRAEASLSRIAPTARLGIWMSAPSRNLRFVKKCCGKETFATREVAEARLFNITWLGDDWGKKPCRTYCCNRGNWHLTSLTTDAWESLMIVRREEWAAERQRKIEDHEALSLTAQAALLAMERDVSCVVCDRPSDLCISVRSKMRRTINGSNRKEKRRQVLSNILTTCVECRQKTGGMPWAWKGRWRLDNHMDPLYYPVLYHGAWYYLNNDGTTTLAGAAAPAPRYGPFPE